MLTFTRTACILGSLEQQTSQLNQEIEMNAPKLEISRTQRNGKPAIQLIVRYATPELRALLDTLNIVPVADISNCRSIICTTPAELDAARQPLASFFDAQGNWAA